MRCFGWHERRTELTSRSEAIEGLGVARFRPTPGEPSWRRQARLGAEPSSFWLLLGCYSAATRLLLAERRAALSGAARRAGALTVARGAGRATPSAPARPRAARCVRRRPVPPPVAVRRIARR